MANRMFHRRLNWCARLAAAVAPVVAAAGFARAGVAVDTRYSPDTGHTYKVVIDPVSYNAASASASDQHGYLATVNSPAEESFVENLLLRAQVPQGSYWLGSSGNANSSAGDNALLWGGPHQPNALGSGSLNAIAGTGPGTQLKGYVVEFGASDSNGTGTSAGGGGSAGNNSTGTGGSTNSPGASNGGGSSGSLAGGGVPGTSGGTGTSSGGTTTGGTGTGTTGTDAGGTGSTGAGTGATGTGTDGTGTGSSGGSGSTGTGTSGSGTGTGTTDNGGTGETGTGTGSGTGSDNTGGLTTGGSGSGTGNGTSSGPAAVPLPAAVYLFPMGMAVAGLASRRMKRRR